MKIYGTKVSLLPIDPNPSSDDWLISLDNQSGAVKKIQLGTIMGFNYRASEMQPPLLGLSPGAEYLNQPFSFVYKRSFSDPGQGTPEVYNNEIYIPQRNWGRVKVTDMSGVQQRLIGTGIGYGDGQLYYPEDVEVYNDEVFVSDNNNQRISVFSLTGTFLRKWNPGYLKSMFMYNGELYAGGQNPFEIRVFNPATGGLNRSWAFGDGNEYPHGMEVYNDELYVSGNRPYSTEHVWVYNLTGTLQRSWLNINWGAVGLTFFNNKVVVLSAHPDMANMFMYHLSGAYFGTFSSFGSGMTQLWYPMGMRAYQEEVYVADQNGYIKIWG